MTIQNNLRSPETVQELLLNAPVTVVTLLEDRAQVRRVGRAHLTPGFWRFRVEQVAPVLVDKSLRAEFLEDYPEARINDVRVRRRMLVRETQQPAEIQALQAELRSLQQTFAALSQDRSHLEQSFEQTHTILQKGLQELPIDAAWGQIDPRSWRDQVQMLFKQIRELRLEILQSYHQQETLIQKIRDLAQQIQAVSRPDFKYVADLETDLLVVQGGEYAIAFDYLVPNAMWRPWHQARLLLESESELQWRMDGCVWQRTGEDWQNVDLVFSTARTSLGTEPPLLQDDVLTVQEKSKQITVQTRDQRVQNTGLGMGSSSGAIELPGVEDGGEVRTLRAAEKATIPSDGRPYRVPLFSLQAPAQVEYVLMPELSLQVVLKSEHTNTSPFPILAGPVDLVRTSGFVGRTSVLFIAPGERFALGWGPDDSLRVQRTQKREKKQDHLTRWHHSTLTTKLFLSNIGADPKVIKTTERVPVSELEQVKIEVLTEETTEGIKPDENGFCVWNFHLQPYSQLQATLVYKVSTAPDVQGI